MRAFETRAHMRPGHLCDRAEDLLFPIGCGGLEVADLKTLLSGREALILELLLIERNHLVLRLMR
jgi:hypothetical protein